MPVWLISWIVFSAVGLALPAILLPFAWHRGTTKNQLIWIPFLAIAVLALSMNHAIRGALIGADYTRRLYVTISVFMALTLINSIIATIRKAWGIAVASMVISLAWFFVGVVNSSSNEQKHSSCIECGAVALSTPNGNLPGLRAFHLRSPLGGSGAAVVPSLFAR